MLGKMPKVYEGDCPYIFVSYAHADDDAVMPLIEAFIAEGYRVWWDAGIEETDDFPDHLADHVFNCACLIVIVSNSALDSVWCVHEAKYAFKLKKRILPIYIEDVELPRGLEMCIGMKRAMYWYEFDTDEAFYRKLFKARRLEPCLTDEGRRRRGVKPKGAGSKTAQEDKATRPVPGEPQTDERSNDAASKVAEPRDGQAADTLQTGDARVPDAAPAHPGVDKNKGPSQRDDGRSTDATQDFVRSRAWQNAKGGTPSGGARHMDMDGGKPRGDNSPATREDSADGEARSVAPGDEGASMGGGPASPVGLGSESDRGRSRLSLVAPKRSLAAYSWAQLKEISQLIAAAGSDVTGLMIAKRYGLVDEGCRLCGDKKAIKLKDGTETSVRILGFRHDDLVGGGKAGISFEFADVPSMHRMNPSDTNEGGWEKSEMRGWLNDGREGFFALLPDDLRPLVETAAKRTNNRGGVAENDTVCVTSTDDRLWLLSVYEVYGGVPSWMYSPATYAAEGSQYRLYADKGVTVGNYGSCRKRGVDGAHSWWWLRSPFAVVAFRFHYCLVLDGDWCVDSAHDERGVSLGFCL